MNIHYETDILMTVPMSRDMPALGKYPISSADMASSQFWENPSIHYAWHGHCGAMHQQIYVQEKARIHPSARNTKQKLVH